MTMKCFEETKVPLTLGNTSFVFQKNCEVFFYLKIVLLYFKLFVYVN